MPTPGSRPWTIGRSNWDPHRCVTRVHGIHASADGLWIQLVCEGDQEISVVVRVTSATRVEDVLKRLKEDAPVGRPLEIIDMDGSRSTPAGGTNGPGRRNGLAASRPRRSLDDRGRNLART